MMDKTRAIVAVSIAVSVSLVAVVALTLAPQSLSPPQQVKATQGCTQAVLPSACDAALSVKSLDRVQWEALAATEVGYWESAIAREGQAWSRFQRGTRIVSSFRPFLGLSEHIDESSTTFKTFRLLIVGSGPSSDVGYNHHPDAKFILHLTDPLAQMYESVFVKYNAWPPVNIEPLAGEDMGCYYQEKSFHFAYSVNALDHAFDPAAALRQMVRAVLPCAFVVVELWEREAEMEKGWGMHKWNFYQDGDRTVLNKFHTPTIINLQEEMHKVGATMVGKSFQGCYLNGDCNRESMQRLRMTIRKHSVDGSRCPPAPGVEFFSSAM